MGSAGQGWPQEKKLNKGWRVLPMSRRCVMEDEQA